jgi:hypothetical protein
MILPLGTIDDPPGFCVGIKEPMSDAIRNKADRGLGCSLRYYPRDRSGIRIRKGIRGLLNQFSTIVHERYEFFSGSVGIVSDRAAAELENLCYGRFFHVFRFT